MPAYYIGTLDSTTGLSINTREAEASKFDDSTVFLQHQSWRTAILKSKEVISWDTRIFTFKLDHEEQILGLPLGQPLLVRLSNSTT